jgi:hypothetical protein
MRHAIMTSLCTGLNLNNILVGRRERLLFCKQKCNSRDVVNLKLKKALNSKFSSVK